MSAPLPVMADLTAEFYGRLATGVLHLQRCTSCGTFRHLPRYLCPACHGDGWEWTACSGAGEVLSWTTTMRSLHPAFAAVPMTLVTVTMAEGPRVLGPLAGVSPGEVRAGLPVVVAPRPVADGIAIPEFRTR